MSNEPMKCGESGCGSTGIYLVRKRPYCAAHGDKARQAARIEAAEFDQMLWGSRKVKA